MVSCMSCRQSANQQHKYVALVAAGCLSTNLHCLLTTAVYYKKSETHQEMRYPNLTSLYFATPLALRCLKIYFSAEQLLVL